MAVILTIIVVMLALALGALAVALVGLSAVTVVAQTSALFSQCLAALVLLALGGVIVGGVALRQRVIQVYLARRLLGVEGDRLLTQSHPDVSVALSDPFLQQHIDRRPAASGAVPLHLTAYPTMPAIPSGWGFDEED
jgi:uncharacterized membrane protein YciS (DUF1049 family)